MPGPALHHRPVAVPLHVIIDTGKSLKVTDTGVKSQIQQTQLEDFRDRLGIGRPCAAAQFNSFPLWIVLRRPGFVNVTWNNCDSQCQLYTVRYFGTSAQVQDCSTRDIPLSQYTCRGVLCFQEHILANKDHISTGLFSPTTAHIDPQDARI